MLHPIEIEKEIMKIKSVLDSKFDVPGTTFGELEQVLHVKISMLEDILIFHIVISLLERNYFIFYRMILLPTVVKDSVKFKN